MDTESMKYQLWAKMVNAIVTNFTSSISKLNDEAIIDLDMLLGYGIAYSGIGAVGMYTLKIPFNDVTEITTKVELAVHDQVNAAVIVDECLDYYVRKTKQFCD